jgi:hypothetical protein
MPDHASRGEVLIHNSAWDVDPDRSRIEFRARSVWGLLPVAGRFRDIGGTLSVGETRALAGMLTINAASVDTSNRLRDAHLRGKQSQRRAATADHCCRRRMSQPRLTIRGFGDGECARPDPHRPDRGQLRLPRRGDDAAVGDGTAAVGLRHVGARGIHPQSTAYQGRHHLEAPTLMPRRHRVLQPVPCATPQPSAPAVKGRHHAHRRQP